MPRLILDNQFKIIFDEPIEVTEDNIANIQFLIPGIETAIEEDPEMTVGPRKPTLKMYTL